MKKLILSVVVALLTTFSVVNAQETSATNDHQKIVDIKQKKADMKMKLETTKNDTKEATAKKEAEHKAKKNEMKAEHKSKKNEMKAEHKSKKNEMKAEHKGKAEKIKNNMEKTKKEKVKDTKNHLNGIMPE